MSNDKKILIDGFSYSNMMWAVGLDVENHPNPTIVDEAQELMSEEEWNQASNTIEAKIKANILEPAPQDATFLQLISPRLRDGEKVLDVKFSEDGSSNFPQNKHFKGKLSNAQRRQVQTYWEFVNFVRENSIYDLATGQRKETPVKEEAPVEEKSSTPAAEAPKTAEQPQVKAPEQPQVKAPEKPVEPAKPAATPKAPTGENAQTSILSLINLENETISNIMEKVKSSLTWETAKSAGLTDKDLSNDMDLIELTEEINQILDGLTVAAIIEVGVLSPMEAEMLLVAAKYAEVA